VRYATSPIATEADFATAVQVAGEPAPHVSGTSELLTVNSLLPDSPYYFALKVTDDTARQRTIEHRGGCHRPSGRHPRSIIW
jgi:hypothetical protein